MNKVLIGIFGLALLGACSGEPKTLKEKKAKLQALQEKQKAHQEKINKLKAAINQLDTTSKKQDFQLVRLDSVRKGNFKHYVKLRGKAKTDNNVSVSPKRSGRINRIYCEEGDQVKQGEKLVQLDRETIQRNIDQIKTNLAHARNLYKRQKNLWEQEIGSEVKYLNAKNRVENLEKELSTAKSRLANTSITAPINGKVDAIFMNPGEMASPASPLLRIVNLRKMKVVASPAERYLDDIRPNDSVKISFPKLGIKRTRPVSHVSSFIDPDTRTFEVNIKIQNKQGLIRPNVLATIRFSDYTNQDCVIIPTKLLQSSNGENYLFTAKNKNGKYRAHKTPIKTGRSYQGMTEILEGLKPNQLLITDGFRSVSDREIVKTPQ
jgi:membrane fusion protein (multidrug efflux system)